MVSFSIKPFLSNISFKASISNEEIDGIKDAVKLNKKKNFKRINIKKILSKIYDLAYIEGYTKFIEK